MTCTHVCTRILYAWECAALREQIIKGGKVARPAMAVQRKEGNKEEEGKG